MSLYEKLIGQSLASCDEEKQKVRPVTGIPMLGLDALSSAAYGPEAALTILLPLGAMGVAWIGPLIGATDPDGSHYQSILSMLTAAVAGRGVFYYLTMGSVIAVVCFSANTSFAGFPRLCRLLAHDNHLP